jgi:Sperm-tail PG-rich repeat
LIIDWQSKSGKILSKAGRNALDNKSITPGPGAYDYGSNIFSSKGGKMSKQAREQKYGSDSVGPGAYDVDSAFNKMQGKPGYKIGKAARNIEYRSDIPGPGQYDYNSSNKALGGKKNNYYQS